MKQEKQSITSTIERIQQEFVKGMMRQNHAMLQYIRPNRIDAETRLSIYRNNIMQNLRYALENTFPYVWALVGKECADHLAYRFCQKLENLPKAPCLDDWGGSFPQFLQEVEAIKDLVYLQYIAELEWLQHKSFRAADFKLLNPLKLQKQWNGCLGNDCLRNDCLEELCLIFNPSVYLFSSPYVLEGIIDLIEKPNDTNHVALQRGSCYAVINRQSHQVVIHWLAEDQFCFFNAIKSGLTVMQSYELSLKKKPDFDVTASLQMLFKNGLLSNYRK